VEKRVKTGVFLPLPPNSAALVYYEKSP